MSNRKLKYVCPVCRGANVQRDALAEWNERNQAWEMTCQLENYECGDCGHEADRDDFEQEVEPELELTQ